MLQENEAMHKRLDEELSDIRFDQQEYIISRTHSTSWLGRARALWNREVELPLIPIGILAVFFLSWSVYQQVDIPLDNQLNQGPRQTIEVGGSTYWEDAYERAVTRDESKDED